MKAKVRTSIFFPLILLSLLALLTYWISNAVQPTPPKLDGSSRHDPDYIVSNFITTQADVYGDLRYKLAAAEMKHFPDDDTTNLQRPHYTQFALNKPYTKVEALSGIVSSNGETIQLTDNVKITRQAFAGKGEMTIETDTLNIQPDKDLVTTQSPVVIRQAPKTIIHATGMIYEKKIRTVTLLHQVRAHYERPMPVKTPNKQTAVRPRSTPGTSALKPAQPVAKAALKKSVPLKTTTAKTNTTKTTTSNINDARIRRRYE